MKLGSFCKLLLVAMLAVGVSAQTPTATLVGRVTDPTGASIPECTVTIRNTETNWTRTLKTLYSGEYSIPQLQPGRYEIVVEKQGFRKMDRTGITLEAAQVARIDVQMQVGAVADSVSVVADAPAINTENFSKGDVIVNREINEMPLSGRDYSDLAYLVPGVDRRADSGQGSGFVINGARGDNTNFLVDGFTDRSVRDGNIQTRPSLDAVQEFKVQTSGYSAEYGKLAGGVMSMVLKSGGNNPHGVLSEYVRNDFLDARNFFDQAKGKLRQHQFAATVDGPVYLPKIYNGKNKTFFLASFEGYRTSTSDNRRGRVPTLLERDGDFNQTFDTAGRKITAVDPLTKVPFPNNRIPISRFNPVSVKLLPYYPAPNFNDYPYNFFNEVGDSDAWDSYTVKIDQKISSRDTLSGRYVTRDTRNNSPFDGNDMGTFGSKQYYRSSLVGLTYTRSIRPTIYNEFRTGFSRNVQTSRSIFAGKNWSVELGIPGINPDPSTAGFPRINIGSVLLPLGPNNKLPSQNFVNNYDVADSFTWVKVKHMIKFGGDILRTQFFQPSNVKINGNFDVKGNYAGDTWGDFLLGMPSGADRLLGSNRGYFFLSSYGFFVQDDYKVTPNLTVNIGLRYEIQKPPVDKYDRMSNFIPANGKIVIADDRNIPNLQQLVSDAKLTGLVGLAKDYGLPRSLVYTNYKNFAPRFGFAWRPFGNTRTVVRSGYGIYYCGMMLDGVKQDMGEIFPFNLSETYSAKNYATGFMNFSNPFPKGGTITGDGISNSRAFEYKPPPVYLQSWNMTTEREIGKGSAVEVSYNGSRGVHLSRRYDWNQPWRQYQYMLPNGTFPKYVPQLKGINMYGFGTNSIYNAGMVAFRKRFSQGFFYRANYTYSKSIDEASQMSGKSKGGFEGGQNMRNLKADRGRSDWDNGHVFTMAFSYEVPRSVPNLLRGWQISGNARAYTGQPFTPIVTGVDGNAGEPTRPDRLAKGRLDNRTRARWFDLSAFRQLAKADYRYGNSGRNILDGPASYGMNVAIAKRFRIGEKHSIQFRGESFNVLNHTNFRIPTTAINDILGGTINSTASGERTMQLALKYQF